MNTEHTKHPCETVDASADVMKLAEMILSDCGQSTVISDSLQRRVAGRIQLYVDNTTQQLQGQVGALLAAMDVIALGELPDGKYANISTMVYAEEACKAAKRAPIKESLTAEPQAEQATLCASCARANVDCPIYPQQTTSCIEHRSQPQAEPVARDVLMAFGKEVKRACVKAWGAADESREGKAIEECDITAIADHYAARLPVEMHSTDLNDRKAAEIIQAQGFKATGYVLSGQFDRYALCNGGAVRWLDKAEYQHTMFPEGRDTPVGYFNGDFSDEGAFLKFTVRAHGALPPSGAKLYTNPQPPVPVPSCPNQYGLDTPYFARWLNRVIPRLDYYRPDDFARELGRMAAAADKTALLQDQLSGAVAQEGADE